MLENTLEASLQWHSHILIFLLPAFGCDMVSKSSDGIIRTIPMPDFSPVDLDMKNIKIEVEHKSQDVNRLSWNHVS